ncbi:hypothetical protein KJ059_04390 [Myxococcota bacterium]|nr:hypothetical protein [Myxococcota bacterium]MCZ7619179.1 hypothetical protein [Myxococcota bacterium]
MTNSMCRSLIAGIAGALIVTLSLPAGGQETTGHSSTAAPAADPMDWSEWISALAESREKVRSLRATVAKMDAEVSRMRSRRYPRGEEKERLLAASERANAALADAEAAHPALLEQARQAGVPAGLLQDFEELPAASR